MAIQFGTDLRNNMVNTIESSAGTAAVIQIRSGSAPADCQTATSGTLICSLTLPSDWFTAGTGGTASKNGTWNGTAAAAGTAAHYRLYNSGLSVCHEQGTVGQGSGDLSLDGTNISSGQVVTVTSWSRSIGNA
jgi:hypothetical protein